MALNGKSSQEYLVYWTWLWSMRHCGIVETPLYKEGVEFSKFFIKSGFSHKKGGVGKIGVLL